ncbi:MAG: S-layer homology domain-containing protein [Oscillospiraceae bacterium]|jgi:spore germination protein YaaH|nr:S-layer homology domain-containing protein [Oscillospiraceae bacterium]
MFKKLVFSILAATSLLTVCPRAAAYDSLTYLYGGTTAAYMQRMGKTGNSVNIVSPDYFETGTDGSVLFTKIPDPLLIAAMRDQNVKVTPFISNHWNRENARKMLERRAEAAEFIASAIVMYNLDGLDVDIQNINEQDRDAFTDFIRLLRAALPLGASLTVCVAANPYYTSVGWQGGYDYARLAEYCDHVFIMTYDESYESGPPGPVASYWFIETSIRYGLQYVPPEKLMIGLPFYGRYWSADTKGAAWTIADIEWLVANTDAVTWYDADKECARATVTIPEGTTVTTWGGRKIKGGVYDVWYEDARSFEKKLALVRSYGLKGVGTWALGQEPAYVWDNFTAWLEGSPFDDIKGHWAQSYILELAARGVIKGVSPTRFEPEAFLTRAEAAALLTRMANLTPQPGAHNFTDTATHWANGEIAAAWEAQLVRGTTDSAFEPDRAITREEFAVMSARYTNLEDTFDLNDSPFSDVSKELTPTGNDAILKLALNNVLDGYADGTFQPHAPITRAEAAKVLTLLDALPSRFVDGEVLPLEKAHMEPR